MRETLTQALSQHFGFSSFREGQEDVITSVIQGHHSAAIFPTGAGKSLCYQLPSILLPHLTLVISPLLALIHEQVDFLNQQGIYAASIDSTQDKATNHKIKQDIQSGKIKVLMISVERLKHESFRQFMQSVSISLLVVDEAHCISEWGHNFRPDYLKLPMYCQELKINQVLLLTATATPSVIRDMQQKFNISPEHTYCTGFYRPNLTLQVIPCTEQHKNEQVLALIRENAGKENAQSPCIIYVTLQHTAEQLAQFLQYHGFESLAYHAGLPSEKRQWIQTQFMQEQVDYIVATIAFGMGIDKSNIRHVIHYDLPKSIENYAQEIGRAGRDGLPALCSILANRAGIHVLENFIYGDTPDKEDIIRVIETIYEAQTPSQRFEVMPLQLSKKTNIRQLPLKTLLVYLELEKIISTLYSYNAEYRFKCIEPKDNIINKFQGERHLFITQLFQAAPKAKIWHQVDFDKLYQIGTHQRSRAVSALSYFEQQGWIELEAKKLIDVYQVLKQIDAIEIAINLSQLFQQKEEADIGRIEAMIDLFESQTCLSQKLAHYFGDKNVPSQCGHCSVCFGKVAKLPKHELPTLSQAQVNDLLESFEFKARDAQIHLTNKAKTRFLCGLNTPLISKLQAQKLAEFGALSLYAFKEVYTQIASSSKLLQGKNKT